jgi:hypothetical protein
LLSVLAQRASTKDLTEVLVLLGVLIGLVVLTGLLMLIVRRRMMSRNADAALGGSVFEDLRRMRDEAQISELEYEYLRRCLAAKAAGREPPPRPPELGVDAGELRAKPGFDLTGEPLPPEIVQAMRRKDDSP